MNKPNRLLIALFGSLILLSDSVFAGYPSVAPKKSPNHYTNKFCVFAGGGFSIRTFKTAASTEELYKLNKQLANGYQYQLHAVYYIKRGKGVGLVFNKVLTVAGKGILT